MKKIILIFLFIAFSGWSQKKYTFDNSLNFKVTNFKDSVTVDDKVYLINSKDNSYFATVTKLDNLNSLINFIDYKNGVHFKIKLLKSDFITVTNINLDCSMVYHYENPFKYKIKYYDFSSLQDTLINNVKFKSYKYTSINKKRAYRKKFGTLIYVVDTSFSYRPLLSFVTAYEDWNVNPKLPVGLLKELHFYNYLNKLESSENLLNFENIQINFIIPRECNPALVKL
ncbi:MAG: hypothetical protein H7Y10_00435 [Flavobacterium sp.]|nr:hypothetical protein [Flavobacterium sp.]